MNVAGLMIVAAITRVSVEQCEGRRCILCDWLLLYNPFLLISVKITAKGIIFK